MALDDVADGGVAVCVLTADRVALRLEQVWHGKYFSARRCVTIRLTRFPADPDQGFAAADRMPDS